VLQSGFWLSSFIPLLLGVSKKIKKLKKSEKKITEKTEQKKKLN
jgi:hypothetical protein